MKKVLIALVVFGLCFGGGAYAAEDTETATVTLVIESLFNLSITNASVSKTLSALDLPTAYSAGYTEMTAGEPTLTVDTNEAWYLKVKAAAANFTYTGSGTNPVKPCGDLSMKDAGSAHVATGWNAYNALTTSNQTIASYTTGVTAESHPCQFRIDLDQATDIPGSYALDVTYTLTTTA